MTITCEANLNDASDLASRHLTLFSTVCMDWRPTFHWSFVYVFMLSFSQFTLFGVISLRYEHLRHGRLVDCY